ncbi:MAG: trimethylamine methyltransferase family protein [Candidatus Bathyarchaeia archaeon]
MYYPNLLSKRQRYAVHLTSLDILQEVGVIIPYEEVLQKLEEAGAEVDHKSQRAFIPHYLAEDALQKTPHRFSVYHRDLKTRRTLGGDETRFGTVGFATNFYDAASRTYRRVTVQDLANATRIADALDNVEFYMCMGSPMDVPHEIVDRYMWATAFENTSKPIINEAMRKEGAQDAIEMASTIVGGVEELRKKPIMLLLISITSPLTYDRATLEAFVEACKLGIPVFVNSGPMAGATSPVTLAGTLALNMAEFISALVIRYVVNKNAPLVIGSWARAMDVRQASAVLGGPEFALLHSCVANMAHYYGIPSAGGGVLTDSKSLDAQMGYEKALTGVLPALAGLNLICGMGLIASENTMSLEGLIIDNEIVSMIKKLVGGFEITDETLAFDVIKNVGPKGSFIKERHTLEHFRREIWIPKITDRTFPDIWVKSGARDLWVKAKEEAEKILKEHQVLPLSKDVKAKIISIIKRRGGA